MKYKTTRPRLKNRCAEHGGAQPRHITHHKSLSYADMQAQSKMTGCINDVYSHVMSLV